jgi:hypothetical protein
MSWSHDETYESQDELQHYGVIGMKWGVRRASRKYAKADTAEKKQKAADKLNKHMDKASKKLNKYNTKGQKLLDKAVQKRYGLFGSNEKYEKAKAKAERQMYKGQKWYNNMQKTFGKQSVVSISDKDRRIGEQYAKFFDQKADWRNSSYNYV